MKTFVAVSLLGFLFALTACSSGDAGSTTAGSRDLNSASSYLYTPDCLDMDGAGCAAFKATNVQRIANGLNALTYCKTCFAMALDHSTDMENLNYFDHTRPDGETFAQRATSFGLGDGAGENIAQGAYGDVVVGLWMNSPGHRANILNPQFKSFAVATFGSYTTQVFYIGTNK